jgi:hypothetical protein
MVDLEDASEEELKAQQARFAAIAAKAKSSPPSREDGEGRDDGGSTGRRSPPA